MENIKINRDELVHVMYDGGVFAKVIIDSGANAEMVIENINIELQCDK